MAKNVVMPALGMAQETGTLIQWLKAPGDTITKGELLMEVETDKTTVEIEAPASGILANVTAKPGDIVPVGQVIALILAPGETPANPPANTVAQATAAPAAPAEPAAAAPVAATVAKANGSPTLASEPPAKANGAPASINVVQVNASPLARRVAAEHNLDLAQVKPGGGRVQKDDVLNYIASKGDAQVTATQAAQAAALGRALASPKARQLALERGLELKAIHGSGPDGAVLTADVLAALSGETVMTDPDDTVEMVTLTETPGLPQPLTEILPLSRIWRVMVDRISQAWTTIPHFYIMREVNASEIAAWLADARERATEKITYTDLLVKLTAAALRQHPRLNAAWQGDSILLNHEINIGLAVAIEDGLVVPVIQRADTLGLGQLAARRTELLNRAQAGKLLTDDLSAGTFTISNLGMYGVDAFNAIVNPPQAAILAVSRIADRVVPLNGVPAVQPMLTLSLSCDHRVVDGARGAQFLQTLANLIEDPMRLWD